jgi:hypothetical protein
MLSRISGMQESEGEMQHVGGRWRWLVCGAVAQGATGELSSCQAADRDQDQGKAAKFMGAGGCEV